MSTPQPRRKILTPAAPPPPPNPKRLAALKAHLTRSQEALRRWNRRLRRAFTEVEKLDRRVAYYQKQITKEEER